MKKSALAAAVILALTTHFAYADNSGNVYYNGDGWYIGMQPGMNSTTLEFKNNNVGRPGAGTYEDNLSSTLMGARIGYGYTFLNGLYLAAQLEGNWQNASEDYISYNPNNGVATSHSQNNFGNLYGISLLPGIHLAPSNLLYLKLGVGNTTYNANSTVLSNSIYSSVGTTTVHMADIGLGFQSAISNNLSLGLEYDYWRSFGSMPPTTFASLTTTFSNKAFIEEMYLLTLTYQFNNSDPTLTGTQAPLNLGWYAGIMGGPESGSASHDDYIGTIKTQTISRAATGFAYEVHLGYGNTFSAYPSIYLGAEVAFRDSSAATNIADDSSLFQENQGYSFSILPGYLINPGNLLYSRVGVIRSNFAVTSSEGSTVVSNQTASGLILGVGYETALTSSLSLDLEYDHIVYQQFSAPTIGNAYSNFNITTNTMNVGLNYRF